MISSSKKCTESLAKKYGMSGLSDSDLRFTMEGNENWTRIDCFSVFLKACRGKMAARKMEIEIGIILCRSDRRTCSGNQFYFHLRLRPHGRNIHGGGGEGEEGKFELEKHCRKTGLSFIALFLMDGETRRELVDIESLLRDEDREYRRWNLQRCISISIRNTSRRLCGNKVSQVRNSPLIK